MSSPDEAAAPGGTLAYVASECRANSDGSLTTHHELRIRRGDSSPVIVAEVPGKSPRPGLGPLCRELDGNYYRFGPATVSWGPFQRLGVSRDASAVVFELTDGFSRLGRHFLTPEQEGLYVVNTDGSGLRRLGPPSRQSSFFRLSAWYPTRISFSPDSRMIAFPDRGPDREGAEASQIMTLDLLTGRRTQVTHLPPASGAPEVLDLPGAAAPRFLDNETIAFVSVANPDELKSVDNPAGVNPDGHRIVLSVKTDGSDLKAFLPLALPGAAIDPSAFVITGDQPSAVSIAVPGQPVNPFGLHTTILEAFLVDGRNVLQLTNFHRSDTLLLGGPARERVFFYASADPFGTNPSQNCQIFSIDRTGTDLRQLTSFQDGERTASGCFFADIGCAISLIDEDPRTHTLVFYSSCDLVGMNPDGGQIFAMRTDGTGLLQLTDTRGRATEADGSFIVELPGPFDYSPGL